MHTNAAEVEGYAAFNENRPRAPWGSQVIRDLVGDRQVGEGAAEIFAAFTRGWERATDEECARILGDAVEHFMPLRRRSC